MVLTFRYTRQGFLGDANFQLENFLNIHASSLQTSKLSLRRDIRGSHKMWENLNNELGD